MKINIACPMTGSQKLIEIEDEKKLAVLYDKRMSQEIDGINLGEEFEGCIFKISGGNDKQGFPMKQGVLANKRVRLLLGKGQSCFRERRKGARKRKSVRGCIVGHDLAVVNLVLVQSGEKEIEGLTDTVVPKRLGPKRASNIRKLFNLSKEDDVRKYVIRREYTKKNGKQNWKSPKIQRLVTPARIERKKKRLARKDERREKTAAAKAAYAKLVAKRNQEKQARRLQEKSDRKSRLSKRLSKKN
eukprot:augustus_masked-scaffold_30-processed-gene-3.1-mRNA-1 protein AED:0.03 eAED:0.03 QI:0/-1/0/1/-1/1/1/0/243